MNKKIALHGGCITENFGDELLLILHEKWANPNGQNEIYLPYAAKEYFEQVKSQDLIGEEALKKSDELIYIGGGYLGETNNDPWRWGFRFLKRKHHVPAQEFIKEGKPFAIIGAGAGPITNFFTRRKVVNMCKKAEIIAVRDEESRDYLNKYGMDYKKIVVTADSVLSLKNEDIPAQARKEVNEHFQKEDKKLFVIHIGIFEDDKVYSKQAKILIEAIIDFINENSNFVPVLLEDKRRSKEQKASSNKIIKNIKGRHYRFIHKDVWTTCALLELADKVITTKLHVGITAYALGTSTFSFAAHQKTRRFYKQINRASNCLDIDQIINTNEIKNALKDFSVREEGTTEEEVRLREDLREKALINKQLTEKYIK